MKTVVITGGINSGKTTTIDLLADQGQYFLPETSASLIEEYRETTGNGTYPWDKIGRDAFQEAVVEEQLRREASFIGEEGILYLDRSIIDEIPFYNMENRNVPEKLLNLVLSHRYDQIFFMNTLPRALFTNDTHRPQSFDFSVENDGLMMDVYRHLGYDPIIIPFGSPAERARFVRDYLNI